MNTSPLQQHLEIAQAVPETKQLAESRGTNLGSFMVPKLITGDVVPLANRHAIEADFNNIDVLSNQHLAEDYADFQAALLANPDRVELVEVLAKLPQEQRELFTASLFAVEVAQKFFGQKIHDKKKRDEFGWAVLDEQRDDSYKIKRLSQTADDGVCAEYSLLTAELMKQLGHEVAYTVGYRQDWPDEPGVYHAFLATPDTSIILDTYVTADSLASTRPWGLLIAAKGESLQERPERPTYHDVFGRSFTYAAVPIPAIEQAA